MRQWWRAIAVAAAAAALHTWACSTQIAPTIETERRFSGTVQAPPAPPVPFDMSLFLRRLSTGQSSVTGGFTAGPVHGSVVGTLRGDFDNGTFDGRLIADELPRATTLLAGGNRRGLFAFVLVPSLAVLTSLRQAPCVVEQTYTGTLTPAGLVWTPGPVVQSCPTNPLNFAIQAATNVQPPSTSVPTTSSAPTTSVSTTTSTTAPTTTAPTTTTSIRPTTTTTTALTTTTSIRPTTTTTTSTTSTSTTSTTSTSTSAPSTTSTTTTSIGPPI